MGFPDPQERGDLGVELQPKPAVATWWIKTKNDSEFC